MSSEELWLPSQPDEEEENFAERNINKSKKISSLLLFSEHVLAYSPTFPSIKQGRGGGREKERGRE